MALRKCTSLYVVEFGKKQSQKERRLHMCTHDFMEELVGIKCPTLIVAAGKESIGHADAYEQMHQRIKGSELVYVDTAGHNICDGYAARCANELMLFLSRQA